MPSCGQSRRCGEAGAGAAADADAPAGTDAATALDAAAGADASADACDGLYAGTVTDLPEAPQGPAERPGARLCARVGCGRDAAATLTADYGDRMMAVGPLSPERTPPALDLCVWHRDALRPPEGWTIAWHEAYRG